VNNRDADRTAVKMCASQCTTFGHVSNGFPLRHANDCPL